MHDNNQLFIASHMIYEVSISHAISYCFIHLGNYGTMNYYLPGIWSKVADIMHIQNNHAISLLWSTLSVKLYTSENKAYEKRNLQTRRRLFVFLTPDPVTS